MDRQLAHLGATQDAVHVGGGRPWTSGTRNTSSKSTDDASSSLFSAARLRRGRARTGGVSWPVELLRIKTDLDPHRVAGNLDHAPALASAAKSAQQIRTQCLIIAQPKSCRAVANRTISQARLIEFPQPFRDKSCETTSSS
jgi:hypothetical protein